MELVNDVASTNVLALALTGALLYSLTYFTYLGYTFYAGISRPIFAGFLFGLVSGRMEECMILGATIQAIYLGLISPGGNIPTDQVAAGCVGIPVWLCTQGMTSSQAVALAVPVGLLFALLGILRYIICGFFVDVVDKRCEVSDTRGVMLWGIWIPTAIKAILGFTVMFLSIYLGSSFVEGVLNALPTWLTHGLEVAGGMLPALGFATTILMIGKPTYVPLFMIGYFMVQYGGLSVMACAIFGICVCLFVTFFRMDVVEQVKGDDDDFDDEDEEAAEAEHVLTTGDVNKLFLRWWFFTEMSHSYQRMQGISCCAAMVPALKKLYPGEENKEKLAAALEREAMYFNTSGIWGSSVLGVALAMEEEQAVTNAMTDEEATASINGVKIGFMGPMAGVGDTIDWSILFYLFIGLGMEACSAGNPAGVLPVAIGFPIVTVAEGLFFTNLGYRVGRTALGNLFTSGLIDRLIECASMIGMMMMGALGSSYVKLALINEEAQATLDSIIPGLLPLLLIFAVYFVLRNVTQQIQWISFAMIGIGIILALVGLC